MPEKYALGPDVDLETEDVRDRHGNRITNETVERLLDDVLDDDVASQPSRVVHPKRGRPSLSGGAKHSPKLEARVSEETHRRAQELAKQHGQSLSELTRQAVETYLQQAS